MVLAQASVMKTWFYITYEKDPILYVYQLLGDYKDGDLHILPDSSDSSPAEREPEVIDCLVGKQVEYAKDDGSKRTGMVSSLTNLMMISISIPTIWYKHLRGHLKICHICETICKICAHTRS